ncbi:MAG: polyprenyl synthetase family protein [Nanoarchaeota archaeon]|nr:polyprenyl synthetase family protein [Nanoarchaeota archaeon]
MVDIKEVLKEKGPEIDRIIEKYIPKKYDLESLLFTCGNARYEHDINAINKGVADPIWDLLNRGGKRWRPVLFLLIAEALGKNPEDVKEFVVIPEVVHNGTLMVDDVEDSSDLRRGKPCTHKMFGVDIAINAGNTMYFLPLLSLIKNKDKFKPELLLNVYEIYAQEMINLSFGQAYDITWHKGLANADNLSEKQYLQMCAYKTGTLARMSAKIAAALSGATTEQVEAIGKLSETIGVAFQIKDDILNLTATSDSAQFVKEYIGSDITEGKRTLMIIHTFQNASVEDKKRLIEILNMHPTDFNLKQEAIDIIKKYDSVNYAKNYAKNMIMSAWKDVDKLFPASEAKEKIKAFADYLVEREN